ncbi:anti-phage dCTP deaminase [Zymomonas mobilis]|uniref:CMP/dCMP deaminase zinc-binding protein n=1 Tax=Zymomonas mobilis subsp. pomaceae (strain ATCC 29192 / DSM 22645 / JCM 10191 / CCUG 17912 / NBRC 13757 / NCIMB 11200 / NRRL B-4491 / Barker I) TaxID=579138 RepID=F8EWH6_ZYMMT|nr:anti-phage dCTP deaminase [Zymomonas mobilis]AEI38619.1 CMP/dCMP deaminase zinc-binding protein [Zymomonas mobilis subsp. pomaceae ATCC 29192]MDX5949536.1 anti-phage dCTP deaminase [Zymomonas mobilis subsp. pomaceae]GEB90119.1 deoxycytidylate deaminase [Zymomonas mobilis subsp. pomaceae]
MSNNKDEGNELFIGIVHKIGYENTKIVEKIQSELKNYGYETTDIHITHFLKKIQKLNLKEFPLETRIKSYIEACNNLRKVTDHNIMAKLAIHKINQDRENNKFIKKAYIINQIKRPEETDFLRKIYGENYIQIAFYEAEEQRFDKLTKTISNSHPEDPKSSKWKIEARELIAIDESEEGEENGQRVREAFPLSDVVLDATDDKILFRDLNRFLRIIFGDFSVTPTEEEYGMEMALTASRRSSDLSRQVGAAIFNSHMEIQALGCNEVPKAGGGTYWEKNQGIDGRDFALGFDSNEKRKRAVVMDLFNKLKGEGFLSKDFEEADPDWLEDKIFNTKTIKESQIMDSLEYGRSVHAEMNAITDAARGGHAIRNGIMYTNTFPCHNCAKHIIASGIEEVIYIKPYPKSYAKELFYDSIQIDPDHICQDNKKVVFRQFIGIVGEIYTKLFTKIRWKDKEGYAQIFEKSEPKLVLGKSYLSYKEEEEKIIKETEDNLKRLGLLKNS